MAACEVCGKYPPKDSVALVRMNIPGDEPGIWRCVDCLGGIPTMHQQETLQFLRDAGLIIED